MILLISNVANGVVHNLTEQKEYIVGRKNCDVLITGDQSISRKHAEIFVKGNDAYLQDCGSKYKTYRNNEELQPDTKIKLNNKDIIKFGALQSVYTIEMVKLATTCSGFSSTKKEDLKKELLACNVKFFDNWTPYCTHLTVEMISLTVKVLQAIVDEKPIVTPQYWRDLNMSLKNKTAEPEVGNYKPALAEILLNKFDFTPNPNRKKLFKDKVFVFLTEESKVQFEAVIKDCGGESISWQSDKLTMYDINISPKEYLIMHCNEIDTEQSLKAVVSEFQKQGKRTIPVQEIGLAILLGSCEWDCNPTFNRVQQVFSDETLRAPTQSRALVQETQSQDFTRQIAPGKGLVIPQSVDDESLGETSIRNKENKDQNKDPLKRLQKEQGGLNPLKKIKTENEGEKMVQPVVKEFFIEKNATSAKSKKRKAEEEAVGSECKKVTEKVNPFAHMPCTSKSIERNEKSSENPFAKPRKPQETQPSTQASKKNPFASLSIRREDVNISTIPSENPFKSRKQVDTTHESLQHDRIFHSTLIGVPDKENLSVLSKRSKVSSHNITWLSKDESATVKKEDLDPEYEKVVKLFKNCVRIEIMDITKRSMTDISNASAISHGKKNFKKFKKVNPVNPQSMVIGKNQLIKYAPGGTEGIERTGLSDEDYEAAKTASPKRNKKTFAF